MFRFFNIYNNKRELCGIVNTWTLAIAGIISWLNIWAPVWSCKYQLISREELSDYLPQIGLSPALIRPAILIPTSPLDIALAARKHVLTSSGFTCYLRGVASVKLLFKFFCIAQDILIRYLDPWKIPSISKWAIPEIKCVNCNQVFPKYIRCNEN